MAHSLTKDEEEEYNDLFGDQAEEAKDNGEKQNGTANSVEASPAANPAANPAADPAASPAADQPTAMDTDPEPAQPSAEEPAPAPAPAAAEQKPEVPISQQLPARQPVRRPAPEQPEEEEDEGTQMVAVDGPRVDPLLLKAMGIQSEFPEAEGNPTIYDIDLDTLEDKPWRDDDADITDWFNYGFTEDTWREYCAAQVKMRLELSKKAGYQPTTLIPAITAPPKQEGEETQKVIKVAQKHIGVIIGKGGDTIQAIQGASGAFIMIQAESQADPNAEERNITIKGTDRAIRRAEEEIEKLVSSAPMLPPTLAAQLAGQTTKSRGLPPPPPPETKQEGGATNVLKALSGLAPLKDLEAMLGSKKKKKKKKSRRRSRSRSRRSRSRSRSRGRRRSRD